MVTPSSSSSARRSGLSQSRSSRRGPWKYSIAPHTRIAASSRRSRDGRPVAGASSSSEIRSSSLAATRRSGPRGGAPPAAIAAATAEARAATSPPRPTTTSAVSARPAGSNASPVRIRTAMPWGSAMVRTGATRLSSSTCEETSAAWPADHSAATAAGTLA